MSLTKQALLRFIRVTLVASGVSIFGTLAIVLAYENSVHPVIIRDPDDVIEVVNDKRKKPLSRKIINPLKKVVQWRGGEIIILTAFGNIIAHALTFGAPAIIQWFYAYENWDEIGRDWFIHDNAVITAGNIIPIESVIFIRQVRNSELWTLIADVIADKELSKSQKIEDVRKIICTFANDNKGVRNAAFMIAVLVAIYRIYLAEKLPGSSIIFKVMSLFKMSTQCDAEAGVEFSTKIYETIIQDPQKLVGDGIN